MDDSGSGLEVTIHYGGRKAHEVASSSTPTSGFNILKRDLAHLRAHAPSQRNVRRVHGSFILHWPMAEMGARRSGPPDSLYSRWIKLCSDDASKLRQHLSIESITVTQDGRLIGSTPPSKRASQTVSPGTLATRSTLEQPSSAHPVPPLGPPPPIPPSPGAPRADTILQSSPLKRRLSSLDDPTSPAATRQKKNHLPLTHPTLPPKPVRLPTHAGSSPRVALKVPSRSGTPVSLARTPTQSRPSSEARTAPPSPAAPVVDLAQSLGLSSLAPQLAHAPPTAPLSSAQPPPAARAPSPAVHAPPPAARVPPLSTRPVPAALLPTTRLPPAPVLSSLPRLPSPPPFDPLPRPTADPPPHLAHAPQPPPDAAPAPLQRHSPPPDTNPDDTTTRRERVHQLMLRQLAVVRAEEARLLDKLDKAGVPVPEDPREEVARLEAELETERARRGRAERALADVERECRQPFVVPALFQAFMRIADVSH